jgi:prepilin-type N-terminal cleavage/methylation domain-containing protein
MKKRFIAQGGFSLAELLIVLVVLGIILYFAFPNIVQVKSDSERELAKARAEALNLAATAYFQSVGPLVAGSNWTATTDAEDHYNLVKRYLAFPAATLSDFLPSADYSLSFDPVTPHKNKATLIGPVMGGVITNISY